MPLIIVDEERCKGCELCTQACPCGIIRMSEKLNSKGYHPSELAEPEKCKACKMCALVCPDCAIEVFK